MRGIPPAAAPRHVSDGTHHFAGVDADLAATSEGLRYQRLDPLPLFIRQIGRVPLRLECNLGLAARALSGPHPKLESRRPRLANYHQMDARASRGTGAAKAGAGGTDHGLAAGDAKVYWG